jgi:hypothetical protein
MTAVQRDKLLNSEIAQARLRVALIAATNMKATTTPITAADRLLWPSRQELARQIMQGQGAVQHWLGCMHHAVLAELDKPEYKNTLGQLSKADPLDDGAAISGGLTEAQEKKLAVDLEAAFSAIYDTYLPMVVAR